MMQEALYKENAPKFRHIHLGRAEWNSAALGVPYESLTPSGANTYIWTDMGSGRI